MKQSILLREEDDEDDREISITAATAAPEISNQINCCSLFDASGSLNKLRSNQTHPVLISLDLDMPVMDGQQLLSAIKSNGRAKTAQYLMLALHRNKTITAEKNEDVLFD